MPSQARGSASPGTAQAVVCQGKKCARSCNHDSLVRALCKVGEVRVVRCQKICHGSVVGLALDGRLEWFEDIDSAKLCVELKRAATSATRKGLPAVLKKRRLKRLAGHPPRR
jgi:hypothetical protein